MDKSVPGPAGFLLDFIAAKEAPLGYDTVYNNQMKRMKKPLTSMTLDEVVKDGPRRTKLFGSSAAGRYQFMNDTLDAPNTLSDLKGELKLKGTEKMTPNLQDILGYHLLKRRGYLDFVAGKLSITGFGLNIAKEWASFPVLAATKGSKRFLLNRGQSYYSGDGKNKVLISADDVEECLKHVYKMAHPAVAKTTPMV